MLKRRTSERGIFRAIVVYQSAFLFCLVSELVEILPRCRKTNKIRKVKKGFRDHSMVIMRMGSST